MATTTNYGWTTPDDTALVKDGASAIRSLGTSVDTTTKNLNPSTTLGDIEYRSSTANTNTRLGIGSTGQVLTVAGGVPSWATPAAGGAMTLLSTTTLSGATVTVSSIDQTYEILYGVITGMTNATADGYFACNPNGDTTLGINSTHYMNSAGDGAFGGVNSPQDLYFGPVAGGNSVRKRTDADNSLSFFFYNYASTTTFKSYIAQGTFINPGTSPAYGANTPFGTSGAYKSNSAITSLVMKNSGGNLSTGTLKLYGIK